MSDPVAAAAATNWQRCAGADQFMENGPAIRVTALTSWAAATNGRSQRSWPSALGTLFALTLGRFGATQWLAILMSALRHRL